MLLCQEISVFDEQFIHKLNNNTWDLCIIRNLNYEPFNDFFNFVHSLRETCYVFTWKKTYQKVCASFKKY